MARHRMAKKRRARQSVLAAAAAAGLSSALVLGLATNSTVLLQLTANTVITAGGLSDTTSVRVQNKLRGNVIPPGYDQAGVTYPATTNLSGSRDAGVPVLQGLIDANSADQFIIVAGYSEGTLLVEQEKRNLQALNADYPLPSQLSFVSIGSPFAANGGIFARFPGISIPGVVDAMGPAAPSRYDTTYYTNEYDTYGDFPAYFNPLALLNTALGITYSHPDPAYDPVDPTTAPRYVRTVDNPGGGTDTYVMFYAQQLPLLAPLRGIAAFTGTTAFVEPFLSAIEPLLRVLVDMAYTDRVNANPTVATPFSLITPPEKVFEALGEIPGALAQGVQNFLNGGQTPVTPPNPIGNLQTTAPAPAPVVAPQIQSSPLRLAVGTPSSTVVSPAASTEESPAPTPTVLASKPSATATPPATQTPTAASTSAAATTVAATPTKTVTPVEGLHPTQTSDGNLFKPGDVATASSTKDGATTTTTTTTGSGTTTAPAASTSTGGATPGAATDDKSAEKAGDKAAA